MCMNVKYVFHSSPQYSSSCHIFYHWLLITCCPNKPRGSVVLLAFLITPPVILKESGEFILASVVWLCCWLTGAVASSLVKQKLQEVILKKQKQAALERTNSNTLTSPPVAYRWHKFTHKKKIIITLKASFCSAPLLCAWGLESSSTPNSAMSINFYHMECERFTLKAACLYLCLCLYQKAGPRPQLTPPAFGLVSITACVWGFRRDAAAQSR